MSLPLQITTMHLPIGSLDAYICRVNQIPMLSLEDEKHWASEYKENGNTEGAKQLILAHLRYVVRVAKGYLGYGLPLHDLIQEGNIGLMKAVKKFDPNMGVRLVSYAIHWIKAEIHEFVLQNWRIVKVATTKAQRKLFFNLRKMKKKLQWLNLEEAQEIAKDLGVQTSDVLSMERRIYEEDMSLDIEDDADNNVINPGKYLYDTKNDPLVLLSHDNSSNIDKLQLAMNELDERSADILRSRWLTDNKTLTLQDLATKYNVSAERIRQLELNALKKLKTHFSMLE